jgi:hypothetical protein
MKKQITKALSRFSHIPTWVFLALFIASLATSVYALRHNNQTMIKLRSTVYEADKNNGDINGSLNNLRDRVNATNAQVYTQAQNYCQQLNSTDFSGRNRVPCVTDYVTTHGVSANPIPAALYEFDFVSPAWSPDLAGWSLVITTLLFIVLIASFTVDRLVKAKLKPL